MSNFATLKKNSSDLSRLTKEIEKINSPQSEREEDSRFWQPTVDSAGNGSAIIRFLPAPAVDGDEGIPWVRVFSHAFKGPTGQWYFENSLTTLNQQDPVSEFNSTLWNASQNDDSPERKQARDQKRKLAYISNIMVISDPKHPENEGKIFLYKYGKKIFDKISALTDPEFEGDIPVNPFSFWEGANFRMKIKNVAGYRNYDDSSFAKTSALPGTDEELEEIWKKEYSLLAFVAPDQFKSYDALKDRLNVVMGTGRGNPAAGRYKAAETANVSETVDSNEDEMDDADTENLKYFEELARA